MYYLINNVLEECSAEQCHDAAVPYVAVLTPAQWAELEKELNFHELVGQAVTGPAFDPPKAVRRQPGLIFPFRNSASPPARTRMKKATPGAPAGPG